VAAQSRRARRRAAALRRAAVNVMPSASPKLAGAGLSHCQLSRALYSPRGLA